MSPGDVHQAASGCSVLWFARSDYATVPSFIADIAQFFQMDLVPGASPSAVSGQWLATDGTSDVLAANWQKDVESPAGQASIHLKRRRWASAIRPGDALLLYMADIVDGAKPVVTLEALLFVDRVTSGVVVSPTGATIASVLVSARDFGKILLQTSTVLDPMFSNREGMFYAKSLLSALDHRKPLSPTESVLDFLDIFYNFPTTDSAYVRAQFHFPGTDHVPTASLLDVETNVQAPTFGYFFPHATDIVSAGNLWNLLEKYANTVVNEFFVDVRDTTPETDAYSAFSEDLASAFVPDKDDRDRQRAKRTSVAANFSALRQGLLVGRLQPSGAVASADPVTTSDGFVFNEAITVKEYTGVPRLSLVLRQRPYDAASFFRLPATTLFSTECRGGSQIGITDHEVANFFRLSPYTTARGVAAEFNQQIVVSPRSIAAFGLRRLDFESNFCFEKSVAALKFKSVDGNLAPGMYAFYTGLLSTWNAFNERLQAGMIPSRFRPDIRAGTRLVFVRRGQGSTPDDAVHFYVSAVSHNFSFAPGSSSSSFTVSRGMRQDGSPEANCRWTKDGPDVPAGTFEIGGWNGFRALNPVSAEPASAVSSTPRTRTFFPEPLP